MHQPAGHNDLFPDEVMLKIIEYLISGNYEKAKEDLKSMRRTNRQGHRLAKDKTIRALLLKSATQYVQQKANGSGISPAITACKYNVPIFIAHHLKENPGFIRSKDMNKMTPLLWATSYFHADTATIELLLEKGANINARNNDGKTPLMLAIYNFKVVALLLEKKALVNRQDMKGMTALMHACDSSPHDTAIVQLLLQYNAHTTITDNAEQTAFHYARSYEVACLIADHAGE